jgi:hypothetical protein
MSPTIRKSRSMLVLALAAITGLATVSDAYAWDNCGVGRHRTSWGQCISNYAVGPGTRGCPPGYHWGDYTRACFPNHE